MARYRKIDLHTWADENFKALSPIPPCGQGLWFFLLTGPFTGPIPGLFCAGRAAMAEALGWTPKAFDKAFQEALTKGMVKADWEARLVWLPKAIKYNLPESPNVITSWAKELDILPECKLLHEAINTIRETILKMDGGFIKAFDKAFGKALPKPSAKTMPNQEQEQEQEQEQDNTQQCARGETSVAVFKPRVETDLFMAIEQTFLSVSGKFTDPPAEINAIRTIMRYVDNNPGDAEAMLATFLNLTRGDDDFWKRQPFTPTRLARPKIWDSVKAEIRKHTGSQRESLEDMERRILAKRAAKVAGI